MKIVDIKSVVGTERIKPQEPATTSPQTPSSSPALAGAGPRDRVTVGAGVARPADAAVASARRSAGAERSGRLERLEAQVRAKSYAPDPSRVAEQILTDAEIDARMQAMVSR